MWKPDESLEDFIVKPEKYEPVEPPRKVWLRPTSEVEMLKPLARHEVPTSTGHIPTARNQPLWFSRIVAVGSGALVMIAFVLVSAIFIGINESELDVATIGQSEDALAKTEETTFDIFSPSSLASASRNIGIVRSKIKRKLARPAIRLAVHKPRRPSRPSLKIAEPVFVPTTLVIYAENGVINTRIEPWLQAAYKPPTLTY